MIVIIYMYFTNDTIFYKVKAIKDERRGQDGQ